MENVISKVKKERETLEIENARLRKQLEIALPSSNTSLDLEPIDLAAGEKTFELIGELRRQLAGKSSESIKLQHKILVLVDKYKQLKKEVELTRFLPMIFLDHIGMIGRHPKRKKSTKMSEIVKAAHVSLEVLQGKYEQMMKTHNEKETLLGRDKLRMTKEKMSEALGEISKVPKSKHNRLLEILKKYLGSKRMRCDQLKVIFRLAIISDAIQTCSIDMRGKIISFLASLVSDTSNTLGIYELCAVVSWRSKDVELFLKSLRTTSTETEAKNEPSLTTVDILLLEVAETFEKVKESTAVLNNLPDKISALRNYINQLLDIINKKVKSVNSHPKVVKRFREVLKTLEDQRVESMKENGKIEFRRALMAIGNAKSVFDNDNSNSGKLINLKSQVSIQVRKIEGKMIRGFILKEDSDLFIDVLRKRQYSFLKLQAQDWKGGIDVVQ